jgi:hypothetical protein
LICAVECCCRTVGGDTRLEMAFIAKLTLLASAAVAWSPQPVFQAYVGYPPCFRQPVLVVAGSSLLAFAEG